MRYFVEEACLLGCQCVRASSQSTERIVYHLVSGRLLLGVSRINASLVCLDHPVHHQEETQRSPPPLPQLLLFPLFCSIPGTPHHNVSLPPPVVVTPTIPPSPAFPVLRPLKHRLHCGFQLPKESHVFRPLLATESAIPWSDLAGLLSLIAREAATFLVTKAEEAASFRLRRCA